MNGIRLVIRDDLSAATLRQRARKESDRAAAGRMMAIANALEGMTRAEAARLAGMERQALRDAVVRDNAEGLDGLHDRPRPGGKPRLDDTQRAQLRQIVLAGPDVEKTGLSAWTLAELCAEVKRRWSVGYHAAHMSKLMRKLGLSRQKARPSHPKADPAARQAWSKGGCKSNWTASRTRIPIAA
jgi:transposase